MMGGHSEAASKKHKTEATIGRPFVGRCVERLIAGGLDRVTPSMAE